MIKLQVNDVSIEEEDDILIVGFKEKKSSQYLILTQSMEEIESKGNSYYLEINDQSLSGYDLIEEVKFEENNITFKLNKKGIELIKAPFIQVEIISKDFNSAYLKSIFTIKFTSS